MGGLIDQTGLFIAGLEPGKYEIRAEVDTNGGFLTDISAGLVVLPEPNPVEDDPQPSVPSDDPTVLLADDFESNHFRRWSGLAPASDPAWNGSGEGGAHIGDGYITNERVHSGKLAWKALVDPTGESFGKSGKSSLENWRATLGVSEFYISAWYYIPSDYPAVSSLIMQIKAAGSGPSHKPVGIRIARDRELVLRSGILDKTLYETGVRAPVGQWFNLVGRFVISDYGLVELWLDGRRIASVRTDTRDNHFAYPGVGNYVDSSDYPVTCYVYIDDVKVTTVSPL